MTKVIGKIESLKALKRELGYRDIDIFNSIADIDIFKKDFHNLKASILNDANKNISIEINELKNKIKENYDAIDSLSDALKSKIDSLKSMIVDLEKKKSFFVINFINRLKLRKHLKKLNYYADNFESIVDEDEKKIERQINEYTKQVDYLKSNRDKVVTERSREEINRLEYIRKSIEELNQLIAGVIGENLVVKEVSKLPNDNILFNDFELKFHPPIFNKHTNDRIYSIQIDHLLITKAGIFILETKNWSKSSIGSFNLRSPIKQVERVNFALFVFVNDKTDEIFLNNHYWGEKKIPIRNIVVMINDKPNSEFKYVKVLTLNELNKYISYFEPVFDKKEIESIANLLEHYKVR